MAVKLGDAILYLAANDKELSDALNKAEQKVDDFGKKSSSVGGLLGNLFKGPLGKIATFGASFFSLGKVISFVTDEINENQLAAQQLNAVLTSTGGIAGVTADQVESLSVRLSELSNFSDDAIVSASSLMLTFTSISSEVFPRAMQASVDLATALNTDLLSAVERVGKALSDPEQAMSSLARSGIIFTDAQKEMVQNYVESNDLIGAQHALLTLLEEKFGGSAKASTDTFTGAVQDLNDALGELASKFEFVYTVAAYVMDGIEQLIKGVTALVEIITSPIEAFNVLTGTYDFKDKEAEKSEQIAKEKNRLAQRQQMMEHGANLMTAEGITREEYDAKYAAIEKAEEERKAREKEMELSQDDARRIAMKQAYESIVSGEPVQGPLTMEEAATKEREQLQAAQDYNQKYQDAMRKANEQMSQSYAVTPGERRNMMALRDSSRSLTPSQQNTAGYPIGYGYGQAGANYAVPMRRQYNPNDLASIYGITSPEDLNKAAKNIYNMQQDQGVVSGGGNRGVNNVIISHANFTAGPDQVRAYNQRRAMMPGVP